MKLTLLLIALAALSSPAWSQTSSSVSTLTVAQDAYLQGGTYFGSLIDTQGGPGFKIDVQQTSSTVQQVVYVPETTVETTAWVDVYDWVDMGYWQDQYDSYEVEYYVDPVYDENGNEIRTDYRKMMAIVLEAGYHGHVGIEYEGKDLDEYTGIRATKTLLETVRDELTPEPEADVEIEEIDIEELESGSKGKGKRRLKLRKLR